MWVIIITNEGILVVDGASAVVNVLERLSVRIANGEAAGWIIQGAEGAAPAIESIHQLDTVHNIATGADWNAITRNAFAATLGILAGIAALPLGPTGSLAAALIATRAFETAYDAASNLSSNANWGRVWDMLDSLENLLPGSAPTGEGSLAALEGWHQVFQQAEGSMGSPIVLDLDGDGVETTNIGAGAFFDLDANGFAEASGWVGKDDGLLVWDRNGDGRIDSGRELFGNETMLASGEKAANGFAALAELDTNHDGVLDASDAAFADLKIWKDADGDGFSLPSELISLADAGVASINVGYSDSSYVDPQGNTHRQVGSFGRTDGTSGTATDVWFQRNRIDTVAEEWLAVPADVAALPDLRGYGNVYDLHQAMVRDTSGELKSLVQSFAAEPDVQARNALFEEILFKWTGVGPYWSTNYSNFEDGRRLEVLEKFMGQAYISPQFGYHAITPTAAQILSNGNEHARSNK